MTVQKIAGFVLLACFIGSFGLSEALDTGMLNQSKSLIHYSIINEDSLCMFRLILQLSMHNEYLYLCISVIMMKIKL